MKTKKKTIMKKTLLSFLFLFAACNFTPSIGQTDSLTNDALPADEIEAFSDTTSIQPDSAATLPLDDEFDDFFDDGSSTSSNSFHAVWEGINSESMTGMFFVLAVLIIIFVVSPIVIIGLILWFIYKNRKNRMRLAEMAMQNGQPIPDDLVKTLPTTNEEVRQKGIRQVCLGIGLIFLLGWAAGKIGVGIGVLVLCIGLGNLLIARSSKNKNFEQ